MALPEEIDEYGELDDFSGLTEEDYALIDATIAQELGQPSILVVLEDSNVTGSTPPEASKNTVDCGALQPELMMSPFEQFRRHGTLSVTDLTSPAWCELQFAYGLLQKRSAKLEKRPSSFVSKQGKIIAVDTSVAARNDRVTKMGKAVHKKLEREIPKEEIKVDASTLEEIWGLRLVNMMWSVDCLLTLGYTREMPVMGLVHDHVVVGIIDEIIYSAVPSPPTSPFAREPSPSHTLSLVDSKTRKSNSLPSDADTTSSRLQLMLYYYLLDSLIQPTSTELLSAIWVRLGLDATLLYTDKFQSQISEALFNRQGPKCLDDLTKSWGEAVKRLNAASINPALKLVYRRRQELRSHTPPRSLTQEDIDLAHAIRNSLAEANPPTTRELLDSNQPQEIIETQRMSVADKGVELNSPDTQEDPELAWALKESLKEAGCPEHLSSTNNGVQHVPSAALSADIIGSKTFDYDPKWLDNHLVSVLKWWNGEREPKGVEIEDSGRCFSCEYRDDCEWREQKAKEMHEKARRKHSSR